MLVTSIFSSPEHKVLRLSYCDHAVCVVCHLLSTIYPLYALVGWLVVLRFNTILTAKVISWQSVPRVFPGFLTPVLTQLFFPKPPATFLTYFCRGERRKYAGKKVCLNRGSSSQPPGHESDTLTTESPGWGVYALEATFSVTYS